MRTYLLAAWAEGITSRPVTMHDGECALRVLGIPKGYRVSIVLAFGYPPPAESLSRGAQRITLEELVHRGGRRRPRLKPRMLLAGSGPLL